MWITKEQFDQIVYDYYWAKTDRSQSLKEFKTMAIKAFNVALTGTDSAPPLVDMMNLLGPKEVLKRIDHLVDYVERINNVQIRRI